MVRLAEDGWLQCERIDFFLALGVGKLDRQCSKIARVEGGLPRWGQIKSWETGGVEARATRGAVDEYVVRKLTRLTEGLMGFLCR